MGVVCVISLIIMTTVSSVAFGHDFVNNFESAAILDALKVVRDANFPDKVSSKQMTNNEDNCQIFCKHSPINIYYFVIDLWSCGWRTGSSIRQWIKPGCTQLNNAIMNNATTLDGVKMRDIQSSTFAMSFTNLGIERLEDFFLESYKNIKLLIFMDNNITTIGKHTLVTPSKLRALFFWNNGIRSFDDQAFLKYKHVVIILMRENLTLNITSDSFKNMPLLQELDLSNNFKINLSRDAFKKNIFLRFVNLTGTQLANFEAVTYSPRVRTMILSDNKLKKLEFNGKQMVIGNIQAQNNLISKFSENTFRSLRGVQSLGLVGNPMKIIGKNAFSFMTDNDLNINIGCGRFYRQNVKLKLHQNAFKNVGRIEYLKIEGCLQNLENNTFNNISITHLTIKKNLQLKYIFEHTFSGLRSTVDLDLSYNSLLFIDNNAFFCLTNLKTLLLNNNKLKTIDSSVLDNIKLVEIIDLSNNCLKTIPENLLKYQDRLKTLNLGKNFISFLGKSFFNSTLNLRSLSLSSNEFKNMLINWMDPLTYLVELDFSGNSISNVGSLNLNLEFLQVLDLSKNLIETIPKKSLTSTSLKKLYIQKNKLKTYNRQQLQLEFIDLSYNNISNLQEVVSPMCEQVKNLKILLNNNLLKNIDTMEFYDITCNLFINLSHNFLTDTMFLYVTSFRKLAKSIDLSFNKIQTLSNSVMETAKKMDFISLQKNSWKCDCENLKLMFYLSTFKDIPCCPINCSCLIADEWNRQLFINCRQKALNVLPYCIAFPETVLDYSYNKLTELKFPQNLNRIKRLNASFNNISHIHEVPLSQLTNLLILDLRGNNLSTVPKELRLLKDVLIISQNPLDCNDCELVHYLYNLVQSTSQSIHCKKTDLYSAYYSCWKKETLTPNLVLTIFALLILIILFWSSLLIYMFYLRRRFPSDHNRQLASRRLYQRELRVTAGLNHQNVLKMLANVYTWNPFLKFNGHLFFEETDQSLFDFSVFIMNKETGLKLHSIRVELIKQVMLALDHIHTLKSPIRHNRVCIESFHVKFLGNNFTLKLLDFSDAEPAIISTNEQNADIIASAEVIRKIASGCGNQVKNVEFQILIKCLIDQGYQAADALQCPALANESSKVLNVGLLNELMIENATDTDRANAERHAGLVIGKQGSWHQLLNPRLLQKFACRGRGYRVSSFTGLLRFSRNVVLHANQKENGDVFKWLCGSGDVHPLPAEIFHCLLLPFPFFYCHALSVLWRMGRIDSHNDVFLKTYITYEREVFEATALNLAPEVSVVRVRLGALVSARFGGDKTWFLEFPEDWTVIPAAPLKAYLLEIADEVFHGINLEKVVVKDEVSGVAFPPLDNNSKLPPPTMNGAKLTMAMMVAHARIGVDGEVETIPFKKAYNVKALVGPLAGRAGKKVGEVLVTLNGQQVGLRTRILDTPFPDHVFELSFV